jgi:uncharacterized protein YbjT (DUF2867 family)
LGRKGFDVQTSKKIAVAGATGRVGHHIVEVLTAQGHEVVPMSRARHVDVITGEGLDDALTGVNAVIDAATGPSAEEQAAIEFFTTAAHNLQAAGERAGVHRMVVVSIVGSDRFTGGYGAAKVAHEQAHLSGPLPTRILRATQFHEFVAQLVDWGRQGEVSYVPEMRTQLVASRSVAEVLAELATSPDEGVSRAAILEVAGPQEESLVEIAALLVARRGDQLKIEGVHNPSDPEHELYASGALLPSPGAKLVGPTFEEWLQAAF